MNRRSLHLIALLAGAASIVVGITIVFFGSVHLDETEIQPTNISNFEHGTSVFNIPDAKVDGISRPLFKDTSDKRIYFVTADNASSLGEFGNTMGTLDFCRSEESEDLATGESFDPIDVKIGSLRPTTIAFCASNEFDKSHVYLLRVKDESYSSSVAEGADYDTDIRGLNFQLSTRTLDLPAFSPTPLDEFVNGTIIESSFNLETSATSHANEGVHMFVLDFMEPHTEESPTGGGYRTVGLAVYVRVIR